SPDDWLRTQTGEDDRTNSTRGLWNISSSARREYQRALVERGTIRNSEISSTTDQSDTTSRAKNNCEGHAHPGGVGVFWQREGRSQGGRTGGEFNHYSGLRFSRRSGTAN